MARAVLSHILHTLHRWAGLLTAAFVLFYSVTGLLLNHRQAFSYFQTSQISHQSVPKTSLSAVNSFIDQYRKEIKRDDAPAVIRIKDGKTIELLYGSHGQTTYSIDPVAGSMEVEAKSPSQPLFFLNNLHKAAKTSILWLVLSDLLSIALIVATTTILFAMRYRPLDLSLLLAGLVLCLAGGLLA
ncbi:MAG: PepSY-associated TM helix domain-containing protein [Desulfobulbaceae bacterium]|nr:PepSY-associated TM helix domain-containing protein [Desulfobulbaceae bacterium]